MLLLLLNLELWQSSLLGAERAGAENLTLSNVIQAVKLHRRKLKEFNFL